MPATIIVEDGTGKADANSYVTLAEANAFFDTVPQVNTWGAQTDDQKTRLCLAATRMVDGCFVFNGYNSTLTQALQWPRFLARNSNQYAGAYFRNPNTFLGQYYDPQKVPALIKQITCEIVKSILDASDDRTADAPGTGIESFEVYEGVKVKFDTKARRPVIPDYVSTLALDLGYVRGGASGNVRIGRS